jgi:Na+-transporting NADH:ubiquinone oxidoreductase subunit C
VDNSTNKIFIFVGIMTVVVALLLAGFRQVTEEQAILNENIFNKRAILAAVEDYLGEGVTVGSLSDAQVEDIFAKQMETLVVNTTGEVMEGVDASEIEMAKEKKKPASERRLPVYRFKQGGEEFVILSVRGNGLWDEIWGNIALKNDLNTVAGASFDHQGETPGLGAEIKDNPKFSANFKGKKLFANGRFVGIEVKKGGAEPSNEYAVDGISGATVTADGVEKMIYDGIQLYQPFLEEVRQGTAESATGMLINQ